MKDLGRTLLQSLVTLRQEKGDLALEDIGAMFVQLAATINPATSQADQFMHDEIRRLAKYITEAKQEIFAISTNDKAEDAIMDASQHLDEVIKSTETATNTIMDAADAIQNILAGTDDEKSKKIVAETTRIYDACTFQDINGQRITRVIKLLASIEERVGKLNELFGTDDAPPQAANDTKADGVNVPFNEKDLLNGPQLAGQAASQDDIDNLFASLGGKN